ncbi:MAG: hypothetical protein JXP34_23705 [Planctomycetes bacterium]|nr:hypothetical protein [Planctomycetota bacterium]
MAAQGWTPEWHQAQIEQYLQQHRTYVLYADLLRRFFEKVCQKMTEMGRVEARAKSPVGFAEKAVRKYEKYEDPIHKITDLCGVRVITYTQAEADRISEFVKKNFTIDWENSLLAEARSSPAEFGYRATHFVVQMPWMGLMGKEPFRKAIDLMVEEWNVDLCRYLTPIGDERADKVLRMIIRVASAEPSFRLQDHLDDVMTAQGAALLSEALDEVVEQLRIDPHCGGALDLVCQIGNRKAEIQIATVLQNAWSAIGHDRLYKSDVEAPAALKREIHRVAALLEESDEAMAHAIARLDEYRRKYLAYLTPAQIDAEIAKWQSVAERLRGNSADQVKLALKIAGLAESLERWQLIIDTLEPFRKPEGTPREVLRFLGIAKSKLGAVGAPGPPGPRSGSAELAEAGKPDAEKRVDPFPHILLGEILCEEHCRQRKCEVPLDPPRDWRRPCSDKATAHYAVAFEADPDDPTALCRYLENQVCSKMSTEVLVMLRPALEAARDKSFERASLHLDIPRALFELGELEILLGKPHEGLGALAKAVYLSESIHPIDDAIRSIEKLQSGIRQKERPETGAGLGEALPDSLDWTWRFLQLARLAKTQQLRREAPAKTEARKVELERAQKRLQSMEQAYKEAKKRVPSAGAMGCAGAMQGEDEAPNLDLLLAAQQALHEWTGAQRAVERARAALEQAEREEKELDGQIEQAKARFAEKRMSLSRALPTPKDDLKKTAIAVVVGTCDVRFAYEMRAYGDLIIAGFRDFEGLVCSAGTCEGIGGVIGKLQKDNPLRIRTIAYVPHPLPSDATLDERYSQHRQVGRKTFSPLQPIQNWIDLLAAGVDASEVRVLGIDGGPIAAFEYRMALALGAWVAVLEKGGREAARLLPDEDWGKAERLLILPREAPIIRQYLAGSRLRASGIPEDKIEEVARKVHEDFCKDRQDDLLREKPNLAEWEKLGDDYTLSNIDQVRKFEEILREGGFEACDLRDRSAISEFDAEDLERMAELEHARYVVERFKRGWRHGPKRDEEKKLHPSLVGWDELKRDRPAEAEKDRVAVRRIIGYYWEAGRGIRKSPSRP